MQQSREYQLQQCKKLVPLMRSVSGIVAAFGDKQQLVLCGYLLYFFCFCLRCILRSDLTNLVYSDIAIVYFLSFNWADSQGVTNG